MKTLTRILTVMAALVVAFAACEKSSSTSAPTISVNSSTTVASCEGGEYGFGYTITNDQDGAVVPVTTEEDWVYDFDLSVADTVTFQVAPQEERIVRRAKLYFTITYEGVSYVDSATVKQTANIYYSMDALCLQGSYTGVKYCQTEGVRCYELYLSEEELSFDEDGAAEEGTPYYYFKLWTANEPSDLGAVLLPELTYSFGQEGSGDVFVSDSYYVEWDDEYGDELKYHMADGTIEVSSGSILIQAEDVNGNQHSVTFSGDYVLENNSYLTSLEADYEFNATSLEARYYGDYYFTGVANWVLVLSDDNSSSLIIDLCATADCDFASGVIPTGTFYSTSVVGIDGTFLSGSMSYGYLSGSWLVSLEDDVLQEPFAPIVSGTLEISDSYAISISGVDDAGNTISGSYSGEAELVDYTSASASRKQLKY